MPKKTKERNIWEAAFEKKKVTLNLGHLRDNMDKPFDIWQTILPPKDWPGHIGFLRIFSFAEKTEGTRKKHSWGKAQNCKLTKFHS